MQTGEGTTGQPMVSVIVPTYQHAPFIAKCLDGILSQQCPWPIEILIGEDGSTDGTREICQRYAEDHPDKIKLFLRDRKDVMYINGRLTGRRNLIKLFGSAYGKYIAICEGDDIWTSPNKLVLQIERLEADEQASGCFTNAYNVTGVEREPYYRPNTGVVSRDRIGIADCLRSFGIPTCTVVARRGSLMPLPKEYDSAPVGDAILFLHLTQHGPLIYIDAITAERNIHPGGAHSQRPEREKWEVQYGILAFYDSLTRGQEKKLLAERSGQLALQGWHRAVILKDLPWARSGWYIMFQHREEITRNWRWWLRSILLTFLPGLMRRYTYLRMRSRPV
jgi:glycosyltransferase involved in cell wall biosynthesis